ncbi:MAG TPA: extracellular solute-binding protein, partial [Acidimicrobiales bacterium]|nr:extracellular solute-binding protein [Acidimicrobiales bacterium]
CSLIFGLTSTPAGASTMRPALSGTLTMNVFTFTTPVMQPVIAAFEKLNPGVTIKAANVVNTPDTYVPLLQTERLAGNEPMIDETYDVLTPTLEVDGLLGDLTPDLKMGTPYPQNYWLPTFEASYIPPKGAPFGVGQVFALANEADATVIMYNEDEFRKAGVPFPQNGWTWSQMLADAAKLKVGTGSSQTQYGICERPDWQAEYNPVLKAYGVAAFTETKATLDTPAALKAWALMIDPMLNGDAVPEAQQQAKNGSSGCEPFFESGEAAMSIEVRGNLPGLQQAIGNKFAYNVVPMPSITAANGKQVIPTGGGSLGWGLAPNAVHNALALAFLHYLFSAAGQAVAEKTFGVVPAVASLNGPTALWRTQPGGPANSEAYVIAANTATIAPQTPGTVFTLSNTDVPNAVTAATTGGESIAKAFTNLQAEMVAAYALNG